MVGLLCSVRRCYAGITQEQLPDALEGSGLLRSPAAWAPCATTPRSERARRRGGEASGQAGAQQRAHWTLLRPHFAQLPVQLGWAKQKTCTPCCPKVRAP